MATTRRVLPVVQRRTRRQLVLRLLRSPMPHLRPVRLPAADWEPGLPDVPSRRSVPSRSYRVQRLRRRRRRLSRRAVVPAALPPAVAAGPGLLTDLLTYGPTRGVIHRHSATWPNHKIIRQRHFLARADTHRHPLLATCEQQVAGSTPVSGSRKTGARASRHPPLCRGQLDLRQPQPGGSSRASALLLVSRSDS